MELKVLHLLATIVIVQSFYVWSPVTAWSNEEFEMFDLVEEIGQNFYETIGVAPDADDKTIRQAYRKLSVKLHPDKNPAEDADVKFRQLVGIYEVLKNKELREAYDKVLVEGLPNWRQPMFYFRRARKLALWQVAVLLLGIVSLGQYLAGWASYFEKRLSLKEAVEARVKKSTRTKRGQKENPTAAELEAEYESLLPKPSVWNLAPFQIVRGTKYMIMDFPRDLMNYWQDVQEQKRLQLEKEREEQERLEKERLKREEKAQKPKKRKTFAAPEKVEEGNDTQPIWNVGQASTEPTKKASKPPVVSGGLWTDDDLAELARLCSKFPGGTPNRWEKIAELLNRPVAEVTFMSKQMLENLAKKAEEAAEVPQVKVKVKTKGSKAESVAAGANPDSKSVENWTTEEQKALENALQIYPKGSLERWEKIARMVPSRTKEECMQRFKYVADMVKKKKEKQEESTETSKAEDNEPAEVAQVSGSTIDKSSAENPTDSTLASQDPADDEATPFATASSKRKKKNKNKSSKKESDYIVEELEPAPVLKQVDSSVVKTRAPKSSPAESRSENVPLPDVVNAKLPTPPRELSQEEKVALQLQSLLDETEEPLGSPKKQKSRGSSSSSKSASEEILVVQRGSKQSALERKNSSSSNTSENDWCVIESDTGSQN